MKCLNHSVYGKYSAVATNSDSVALLTLIFDVVDLACAAPIPNDTSPPVWLLIFSCMAYVESTKDIISVNDVAPITLISSIVRCMNPISLLNFIQSFVSILDTRFIRKYTVVSMSGRPLLIMYPSFDVIL